MRVISHQGDSVDAICYRHFGPCRGLTEQVLQRNPGLAGYGPVLPMGVAVLLPDQATPPPATTPLINLWD